MIIFYEDKNFQGQSFQRTSDSSDLHYYFNHCNSVHVKNGNWILYEHPNYQGHQYFLQKGEYPDFQHWFGYNDIVCSCRLISQYQETFKIRLYAKENFSGEMIEFTQDCSSTLSECGFCDIFSCNIIEGNWIFYEKENFRGQQFYLKPAEYKRCTEWGALSPRVGSFRRAPEFHQKDVYSTG
ncbi:gamma-crystallin 1-like [Leptodactylus fuscus]|uniref:gamma-crystallin 1-like n=1 Tax=Leptodactylus fuscus TaxID=238119 RepID=UPI003F4EB56C